MRALLLLALAGCDDSECPGPARPAEDGTATWCETPEGVRDGRYSVVNDGVVRVQGQYVAGEETGTWTWRWPDGSLQRTGTLNRGEPTGEWRRFTEDGTPLPLALRGRAIRETEGVVLENAHPDPAVFTTTWLGAPVFTPTRAGDLIIAPQATGLVAVDAQTGAVQWQIDSPSRLADLRMGDGLRTAIAFTERGDALVTWLSEPLPAYEVLTLGAHDSPAPVANDFGIAYVDAERVLHDQPLDRTVRAAPDVDAATLTLSADRLFIGTDQGQLIHWERLTGRERWSVRIDGTIRQVLVPNWRAVVITTPTQLIVLDFATGEERWRQPTVFDRGANVSVVGDSILVAVGGSVLSRDLMTGVLRPDTTASALRGPVRATDPSGLATIGDDEVRIARSGELTLRARVDMPSPPLIEPDGAWVGTRSGLLLHLRDLPLKPPALQLWSGRVLTRTTIGGRPLATPVWSAWTDVTAGAARTALPLGDQRGAETDVHTVWFDLPSATAPQQRIWPAGWEHQTERMWHATLGDIDLWTSQTPPPGQPSAGPWLIEGIVANGPAWSHVDAVTIDVSATGPTLDAGSLSTPLSTARATPWRATQATTASWSGVPIAPWIPAWTTAPRGWLGWTQIPRLVHETPSLELETIMPETTE